MSIIRTEEALRAVIGEAPAGLQDKNIDRLDHFAVDFIAKCPFLILTTADANGRCDASPKGDAPGFVRILDEKTLVIPDRPGNRLAYGHLNILSNAQVGLLFILPGTSETLRVNGTAELDASPELLERLAARGKPAVLGIRVTVEECFFHCAKAFIRSALWQQDIWPKEPHRVSFGDMFAERRQLDQETARAIDQSIEADYESNL